MDDGRLLTGNPHANSPEPDLQIITEDSCNRQHGVLKRPANRTAESTNEPNTNHPSVICLNGEPKALATETAQRQHRDRPNGFFSV